MDFSGKMQFLNIVCVIKVFVIFVGNFIQIIQ